VDQMAQHGVRATIVGSPPKPGWLAQPGELFPPWRLDGPHLEEGRDDAVRLLVAAQERAGIDVVTDGEQRRRHYIWGLFPWSRGNRHRQSGHAGPTRSALS
jgi:5-methyltetrahydropteroyltriglutamate--homocysteine methyltransferase